MDLRNWINCNDPEPMIRHLRLQQPFLWHRRHRDLFAAGCLRQLKVVLSNDTLLRAVESAEDFADGATNADDLHKHYCKVCVLQATLTRKGPCEKVVRLVRAITGCASGAEDIDALREAGVGMPLACDVLRDIIDHPLRRSSWHLPCDRPEEGLCCNDDGRQYEPLSGAPAFGRKTGEVCLCRTEGRWAVAYAVAGSIRDERRFQDVLVLADALEDAGMSDHCLLDHLRSGKPHVRGCVALDSILVRN